MIGSAFRRKYLQTNYTFSVCYYYLRTTKQCAVTQRLTRFVKKIMVLNNSISLSVFFIILILKNVLGIFLPLSAFTHSLSINAF